MNSPEFASGTSKASAPAWCRTDPTARVRMRPAHPGKRSIGPSRDAACGARAYEMDTTPTQHRVAVALRATVAALILFAVFSAPPTRAADPPPPPEAGTAQNAELISREDAADLAKEQRPGQILDVKLKRTKKGEPFYRVKVLREGKVSVVHVDAITGKVE